MPEEISNREGLFMPWMACTVPREPLMIHSARDSQHRSVTALSPVVLMDSALELSSSPHPTMPPPADRGDT